MERFCGKIQFLGMWKIVDRDMNSWTGKRFLVFHKGRRFKSKESAKDYLEYWFSERRINEEGIRVVYALR